MCTGHRVHFYTEERCKTDQLECGTRRPPSLVFPQGMTRSSALVVLSLLSRVAVWFFLRGCALRAETRPLGIRFFGEGRERKQKTLRMVWFPCPELWTRNTNRMFHKGHFYTKRKEGCFLAVVLHTNTTTFLCMTFACLECGGAAESKIKWARNVSINQSIDQTENKSINQSTNQSIYHRLICFWLIHLLIDWLIWTGQWTRWKIEKIHRKNVGWN